MNSQPGVTSEQRVTGQLGRPGQLGPNGRPGVTGPGVAHRQFAAGVMWGLAPVVAAVVLTLGSVALRL